MNLYSMTLRQKIGQLMMFGFVGTTPSPEILHMIEKEHVGGVIFFSRNIGTPEEVLKLTSELQDAAKRAGHPYPLLISIDQENGVVRRLGEGTTVFPGNMLLGAIGDEKVTEEVASATAHELHALGINMNLAPVLDVNNNPNNPVIGVRSFGESVEAVSRHGLASIRGHQKEKVITTIKHFPGHGDTDIDSHLALPTIAHSLERLAEVEFVPFEKAITGGADCVMVAHVYFPALEKEPGIPATISKDVITGLLRKQMGFDGVITTDCLEMNAISETVGTPLGALQALKAGIDILMISHRHSWQKEAIELIVEAVEKGEVSEAQIDQAVKRILKIKAKYLSWGTLPNPQHGVSEVVGGAKHQRIADKYFARGITLVKDSGILPLNLKEEEKILVIYPESKRYTLVEDRRYDPHALAEAIAEKHQNLHTYRISTLPTEAEIIQAIQLAEESKLIIVGTLNAHLMEKQAEMVKRIIKMGKQVIAVAMRNPYDLAAIPDVSAFIATYEFTLPALKAATGVLFGELKAEGRLPVTIPGFAKLGDGLEG